MHALEVGLQTGKDAGAEIIIDSLHDGRPDEQHRLDDAQPDLQQPPPEEKKRDKRQCTSRGEQNTHVEGRLRRGTVERTERESVKPEFAALAGEPGQRREERDGHEGRCDEQIE